MRHFPQPGAIHVKDLRLWSHVGVLDHERLLGQWFSLDFTICLDLEKASKIDSLEATIDYSLAIEDIQQLASKQNCQTIEYFSEQILLCLESIYGPMPTKIILTKCNPPIDGFTGSVCIERFRNWKFS